MFKIGEFSKLTQVSIRMLRYYDETGVLKPALIDRFSGYRLYCATQIPLLNKIVFLRDVGFTIADIAIALNQWDDELITNMLNKKHQEIEAIIKQENARLLKIAQAKKDIQQETIALHYNVTIKSIPSYLVFSLRCVVADYYAEGELWQEMLAFADTHNIAVKMDTFSIYHDADYKETDVDIEVCLPVAQAGTHQISQDGFTYRKTEAVPTMACTLVYGGFHHIKGAYLTFADWLQKHNQYVMTGKNRQIVHRGPWNETNPDNYLTEIQIPLALR